MELKIWMNRAEYQGSVPSGQGGYLHVCVELLKKYFK